MFDFTVDKHQILPHISPAGEIWWSRRERVFLEYSQLYHFIYFMGFMTAGIMQTLNWNKRNEHKLYCTSLAQIFIRKCTEDMIMSSNMEQIVLYIDALCHFVGSQAQLICFYYPLNIIICNYIKSYLKHDAELFPIRNQHPTASTQPPPCQLMCSHQICGTSINWKMKNLIT